MTQRLSIFVAAVLGASGCVADQPLVVTGLFSPDPTHTGACDLTTVTAQASGVLDLAGGGTYLVNVGLRNDLVSPVEATLISPHTNLITLDTATFTYTSVPAIAFSTESTPMIFEVPPGSLAAALQMGIFTRNALEKLNASLPGTTNVGGLDVRDLKVKIVLSGSVASGGRISTAPVIFPITVFNSGFLTCPPPGLGLLGPCGRPGGQDGTRICCASDATCVKAK